MTAIDQREAPTLLAIGGLDPSGGAGLLIDGAAARRVGAHPAGVAAVITVQDGNRYLSSRVESPEAVREAASLVLDRGGVGAVKTGALGSGAVVDAVAELAARPGFPPLIVDPVLASTSGGSLLDEEGREALAGRLLGRAHLVTPNVAEAELLTGVAATDEAGMGEAARRLIDRGARAVLVKGGHLEGDRITDIYLDSSGRFERFERERLAGGDVRGTGCALASLIGGLVAGGLPLDESVARAVELLVEALAGAREVGGSRVLGFFGGP